MDLFINIMSLVLPLYVVIVPKGQLTQLVKSKGNPKELSFGEKMLCMIPIYNSYLIRSSLYGSSPRFLWLFNGAAVILALNFGVRLFLYENPMVLLATTLLMLVVMLIIFISEAYVVAETNILFSKNKWLIFSILVPPVGAWIIMADVKRHFKSNKTKLEGTFDERAQYSK